MSETTGSGAPPRIELRRITKRFPGVLANDDVSFRVQPGEIHALLGENGAGKSTLVKIIYGVLHADDGQILWDGLPVTVVDPHAARKLGIGMVFQHFSLFEAMTVLENIALGLEEPGDIRALADRIVEVSQAYGLPLDPTREVHTLSVGERQRIEIVRCLLQSPRLLIMDEPTSVLTPQEVERLFETLRQIAREGCSILYISHKLHEIQALCHNATILRGGRRVAECDPKVDSAQRMAELMVGADLKKLTRPRDEIGKHVRLEVDGLDLASDDPFGVDLKRIHFDVHAGEIFGIGGVAGNGQSELFLALSGEQPLERAEAIRIDGRAAGRLGPSVRRRLGLAAIPEERNGHGAVPSMSLMENALLSARRRMALMRAGFVQATKAHDFTAKVIEEFSVKTPGTDAAASSLSGGNLQKYVVGREILQNPDVLIVSQPTWGVDAGAAVTIHQALINLAATGAAIVVISQDLDELLTLTDRLAVINVGVLSDALPTADASIEEIGLLMGGLHGLDSGRPKNGGAVDAA